MNKKIRELSEQADFQALDIFEAQPDFPKNVPFDYFNDNRNRIFVKLIIKECCDIIQGHESPHCYVDGIIDDIKNQFGIILELNNEQKD